MNFLTTNPTANRIVSKVTKAGIKKSNAKNNLKRKKDVGLGDIIGASNALDSMKKFENKSMNKSSSKQGLSPIKRNKYNQFGLKKMNNSHSSPSLMPPNGMKAQTPWEALDTLDTTGVLYRNKALGKTMNGVKPSSSYVRSFTKMPQLNSSNSSVDGNSTDS